MMKPTKEQLLERYAAPQRVVRRFYQYDGFLLPDGGDDILIPDDDGDVLSAGVTFELNASEQPVRVWVHESTAPADAVRLLRKVAAWIERCAPDLLHGDQGWRMSGIPAETRVRGESPLRLVRGSDGR